ncbi:hypothetical protein SHKM778_81980 [Streptomyces sp. KM77-8]|uniref:RNase VapC n=1 Tax=Streptomyces haneummycinicus TaxID=3074435 RepID=A0AAT9HWS2_9ACTN
MIVIDTGPVVAAANRKDDHHADCVHLLENHPGPLLLPSPLVAEIGYMLSSRAGVRAEADFLRDVADGVYDLVPVTSSEAARAADLVERYANLPWEPPTRSSWLSPRSTARPPSRHWTAGTSASSGPSTCRPSPCFPSDTHRCRVVRTPRQATVADAYRPARWEAILAVFRGGPSGPLAGARDNGRWPARRGGVIATYGGEVMAEHTPRREQPRLRPAPLLFEPAEAASDPEHFFDLESVEDPRELLERSTELTLAFRAAADRAAEFQAMAAAQLADPRRFDRLTPADIAERAEWTEDYAKKMVEFGRDLLRGGDGGAGGLGGVEPA